MIDLNNPQTWLEEPLTDMQGSIESIRTSVQGKIDLSEKMASMGCLDTSNSLREQAGEFNHKSFSDLEKAFHFRVRSEHPDPSEMVPGMTRRDIMQRITFMQEHGYNMVDVAAQYKLLERAPEE